MGSEMMGPGSMHHGMMGRSGYGHPGRYDCPYGGSSGGYGSMMGSEMMGPGGHRGMMGPGGWDRDYSRKYHRDQGSQAD